MTLETKHTFCRICEAGCGLELDVEDNKILDIRPNKTHLGSEGFACMKGLKQHKMYASPDRLTVPLKRVGDEFKPISWKQANKEMGAKLRKLRAVSPQSISMYVGTAAGFSILHPIFAEGFMQGIGSHNIYSSATQDCANRFASATEMYGFPFHQPFPDLENMEHILIIGTNPVVSKWTFLQVPNPAKKLKDIQVRGGKVVVIDPRLNETAKLANQHVFINPNADVFFFLSFLHEVFEREAVDHELIQNHMEGLDKLSEFAANWPAEKTSKVTDIAPDVLRGLVDDYLAADGAGIVTGTGLGMGKYGTTAHWLAECINAITGNLDRKGGMVIGEGIFDFAAFSEKNKVFDREHQSRIGGFKALNGGFPGAILADEILTPGEDQIKALFVTGGNPLMTMANSERLRDAFKELELMVVLDIYLNETASLADYVLPTTSALERADLPFIFPLFLGMQSSPHITATEPVIKPLNTQRDEATIYTDLAKAAGIDLFGSKVTQFAFNRLAGMKSFGRKRRELPLKFVMNLLLKITKQKSFKTLLKHKDGLPRPKPTPGSFLGARLTTDNGKLKLAPNLLMAEIPKLEAAYAELTSASRPFRMITKRVHHTHNSWTQNIDDLVRGEQRSTNRIYMHPVDALALGLDEGDPADITSDTGRIRLPVGYLKDLKKGVVAIQHGWGHQHAKGLSVASSIGGANVNILAADGPDAVEVPSGMVHLTGIPVDVVKSNAPINARSWSGM